MHCEGRDH